MQRIYLNLDNGGVQTDRSFPQNLGDVVNSVRGGIRGRVFEDKTIDVGFCRNGVANTIQMASPALGLLLKRDTGTQKFDAAALNAGITWAETTETAPNGETDYFYRASLDLAQPVFAKLLGVDVVSAKEQVTFRCVADVSNSLHHTYLSLAGTGSVLKYVVFYTSGTAEEAAAAAPSGHTGGGVVSIATNATAAQVATALAAVTGTDYTGVAVDDLVTFTAATTGARGWHSAGSTGFEMTLLTAGSAAGAVDDVESVTLLAQFHWNSDGGLQISELFSFTLCNSLYRDGAVAPGISTGRVRMGEVAIGNGTNSAAITFSSPMPVATWVPLGLHVINTTDGAPLNLTAFTITARSESGFTVKLNADTDSANYRLSYVCIW